jgi:hypothetical protein
MRLIDNLKILTLKTLGENYLEIIDFENDYIFQEPLLYAYFNLENHTDNKDILKEILQGYEIKPKNEISTNHALNTDNVAYIPNLGYYNKDNQKIDDLLFVEDLEVLKEIHPLLHPYLFESYKGHITNRTPNFNSVWDDHIVKLEKALKIIKMELPDFHIDFKSANFRIFIHDNPKILNFTTIQTLGQLYFYATPDATLMYFIEELIHQGAHNMLYHLTHPKTDFFKIDAENIIMRELTKQDWDYRDVYGAFHGVYTVYKRLECYDILIQNDVLSSKDKHELYGRMADQFPRFRTGLELLPLDIVYTDKGKTLYLDLDKKCEIILNKYKTLRDFFDLSFRDLDFNYTDFEKYNPYEKFLQNEAKFKF